MANWCRTAVQIMAVIHMMGAGTLLGSVTNYTVLWGKDSLQETIDLKRMISSKLDKLDKLESIVGTLTGFPFKCSESRMRKTKSVPVGTMKSGDHLYPEESFCSNTGDACLYLRNDGNLVLYRTVTNEILWSSNTSRGHCSGDLTNENGRLVLYTSPAETVMEGGKPVNRISWAAPAITCQKLPKKGVAPFQDLGTAYGKVEADCCMLCRETPNCKAYTINSFYGSCWLKPATTPVVDEVTDFSGILVDDTAGLELSFQANGHLCLKAPASADCRWSTYDLMYKAK